MLKEEPPKQAAGYSKEAAYLQATRDLNRRNKKFFICFALTLIFLIIAGVALILLNSPVISEKFGLSPKLAASDIATDQILIKTLITNDAVTKQLKIMNTGKSVNKITLETVGLSNIVKFSETSFELNPGQTKTIDLTFSSKVEGSSVEQSHGAYVGKIVAKSATNSAEVPTIIEIESTPILFDVNINVPILEREVIRGKNLITETRIFNLKSMGQTSVKMFYIIADLNGNAIITEEESVGIGEQATVSKTFHIPENIQPGIYALTEKAVYGSSVGTASYIFEVKKSKPISFIERYTEDPTYILILLVIALTVVAFIGYTYFFIRSREFYKAHKSIIGYHIEQKEEKEGATEVTKLKKKKSMLFGKILIGILIAGGAAFGGYLWKYNQPLAQKMSEEIIKGGNIAATIGKNLPYTDWQFYIPAGIIALVVIWVIIIALTRKKKEHNKKGEAKQEEKPAQPKGFFARWKARRAERRKEKLRRKMQKRLEKEKAKSLKKQKKLAAKREKEFQKKVAKK